MSTSELAKAFIDTVQGAASFIATIPGGFYAEPGPDNAGPVLEAFAVYSISGSQIGTYFGGTAKHELTLTVDILGPRDSGSFVLAESDTLLFENVHGVRVEGLVGFDRAQIQCLARGSVTTYADAIGVRSDWRVTGFLT
jgi:hypothetical protein